MPIPANLIRQQARLLNDRDHSPKRAKELAAELELLNRAIAKAGRDIELEDEPGDFLVVQQRGRADSGGAKS